MRLKSLVAACFASRAVAFQYTPGGTAQHGVMNGVVTTSLLSNMEFFAQYAAAAYCVTNYLYNSTTSNFTTATAVRDVMCLEGVCPDVIANNATNFFSHIAVVTNQYGFISIDPTRSLIVLSLIGSISIRNFITDFNFIQSPCPFGVGCRVHTGFNTAWIEIQREFVAAIAEAIKANPSYSLVVTGHSLGGAVATIAAATLRQYGYPCELYTYGSPRVFNSVGAAFVSTQPGGNVRVTHWNDPVPSLPPLLFPIAYRHTSPEYWLSQGNETRIDYQTSQIKICYGSANVHCNAQFWHSNILAHTYYFQDITACVNYGTVFKRNLEGDEAQERCSAASKADIEYFKDL